MKSIIRAPRGGRARRLGVLPRVVLAVALAGVAVAGPALSQSPDSSGKGTVTAKMTQTAPMTFPQGGAPCLHFHVDGRSDPGYRGTYVATDNKGGKHTYNGDLTVTVVVETNESPFGTHQAPDCSDGTGEYEQPIKSASLTSPGGGGQSVACTYSGTYNIRNARDITIKLNGTCELKDQGFTYALNTTETRRGQVFSSNGTPPTEIKWSEEYTATTTCVSASCNNPGPTSPSSGRPVAPPRQPPRIAVAPAPVTTVAPAALPLPAPEVPAAPAEIAAPPEEQFSERGRRAANGEDSDGAGGPGTPLILLIVLAIAVTAALTSNWVNQRRLISWPLPWPSRR